MISSYTFVHVIFIIVELLTFNTDNMTVRNFDRQMFDNTVENAQAYEMKEVKNMIVPHHLLASDLIANMYLTASNEDIERIILISPDHNSISNRKVITSKKDWDMVSADEEYVDKLLELSFVYEDNIEIEKEHGINVHIPYIDKYFRNAEVTPLAVSKEISKDQLDELVELIGDGCMIISSVDFSHYLSLDQANKYDEITEKIMMSGDSDLFFGLSDKYFDSQGALYIIFSHAEKYGYETYVLDHGNSAYYISVDIPETTSYYVVGFK